MLASVALVKYYITQNAVCMCMTAIKASNKVQAQCTETVLNAFHNNTQHRDLDFQFIHKFHLFLYRYSKHFSKKCQSLSSFHMEIDLLIANKLFGKALLLKMRG